MKLKILLTLVLASSLAPALRAEEGGCGHYMPGAMSSFIDVLPDKQVFVYANLSTYYDASASGSKQAEVSKSATISGPLDRRPLTAQLTLGGKVVANVDATVYANTSLLAYQTPWEIFGGRYGAGLAIPYYHMEVQADVQVDVTATATISGQNGSKSIGKSKSASLTKRDTADGLGDIMILPVMLGWKKGDVSYGTSLGVYVPTGDYEQGQLANLGKNYWTFEPSVFVSWLSSKIGTEVSAFAGYDVSTENQDTDYQSGEVAHLDTTVAQHLPFFGGFIGVGANAFYYKQITGDSGDGAVLGDFKGQTMGVGPVLSYATKIGKAKTTDLVMELKWLPESDVDGRLEGDIIWAKVALVF